MDTLWYILSWAPFSIDMAAVGWFSKGTVFSDFLKPCYLCGPPPPPMKQTKEIHRDWKLNSHWYLGITYSIWVVAESSMRGDDWAFGPGHWEQNKDRAIRRWRSALKVLMTKEWPCEMKYLSTVPMCCLPSGQWFPRVSFHKPEQILEYWISYLRLHASFILVCEGDSKTTTVYS